MLRLTIATAALSALLTLGLVPAQAQTADTQPEAGQQEQGSGWWGRGEGWGLGWGGGMMGWGGGGMMGNWDRPSGPMMGRGPGRGMMGGPAQFIEGRIAFLRAELQITEDQEDLFEAYSEAVKSAAEGMQPMHQRMWSGEYPETLPERLQLRIDEMSARLEAMEAIKEAAQPLYESFSDEQKEVADTLMGLMGMM